MSRDDATYALRAIVPENLLGPFRHQAQGMLRWLITYMPVRVEHEVNRFRGHAFTSNEDEGFSHV